MSNNNRELSQFAGRITVDDTTKVISVASTIALTGGATLLTDPSSDNIFLGGDAGTGTGNVVFGNSSGNGAASGDDNVILGNAAAAAAFTGDDNVIIGPAAGEALTSGAANVFVGKNAGDSVTTGTDNIIIGRDRDVPSTGANPARNDKRMAIGVGNTDWLLGNKTFNTIVSGTLTLGGNYYQNGDNTWQDVADWPISASGGAGGPFSAAGGGMIHFFVTNHFNQAGGRAGQWMLYISYNGFDTDLQVINRGSWPSDGNFDVRVNGGKLQIKAFDSGTGLPTAVRVRAIVCDVREAIREVDFTNNRYANNGTSYYTP